MKLSAFAALAMLITLVCGTTYASEIFDLEDDSQFFSARAKDWKSVEDQDPLLQTPVCRALTAKAKSTLPVELSISLPKDPSLLPVVYVKITGLQTKSALAQLRFNKKDFQPLFLIQQGATPQDPDIYWYAPKDLPRFAKLIDGSGPIDIAFSAETAAPVPVRFTTSGSSAALDQAVKCAKRKTLLPEEFLKALNQAVEPNGELPPNFTALDMLAMTQKAYRDYLSGRSIADSLAQLRKAMKPLTDKEAVALKDLAKKTDRT